MTTMTPSSPLIQGIPAPQVTVDPEAFKRYTRRMRYRMQSSANITGLGSSDQCELRKSGIVAGLEVRVFGTITWGGTITGSSMSFKWPFDLVKAFKLSANGQSQLINARGGLIRAYELLTNSRISDQGVSKVFNNVASVVGTMALSTDDWGTSAGNALSPGTTVPAIGTYTVDLTFFLPVCADYVSLIGSIFGQSAATSLVLSADWETQANLVTVGGSATFASALKWAVTGLVYSIPNVGGKFIVPDLSLFHQLVQNQTQANLAQGTNEIPLIGAGTGRNLMRTFASIYSGAGNASQPVAVSDANYSSVGWAFGGSDVPEQYDTGQPLRALNLRQAGSDLGLLWGFNVWDFASQNALRDIVDEGSTSDLRLLMGLVNSPTSPVGLIGQETLFAGAVGA